MLRELEGVLEMISVWLGLLGEGSMRLEDPKLLKEPSKTSLTTPSGAKCIFEEVMLAGPSEFRGYY